MTAILTRKAQPADEGFVRGLNRAAYKEVVTRQFGQWNEADQNQRFSEKWAEGHYRLITQNQKPIGAIWTTSATNPIVLNEILVSPERQGQGVGTTVISELLRHADVRGVPTHLRVLFSSRARGLYERLGFAVCDTTDTHFLMERVPPSA